jgi:glucosamine--fructose-6-phosphate aminotransferase (isomerizing)
MTTVTQSTLNIKELAKVYAEGISIGQFRHGPIEVIDPNFHCICVIDDIQTAKIMDPTIRNILFNWGNGKVLVITNQQDFLSDIQSDNLKIITTPISNPYLAPIYDMILLQPWLCLVTEQRGFVPGEFRNTHKITK